MADGKAKLVKVRLSYPYLGVPDETDTGKKVYRARFLTCPDDQHFDRNKAAIKEAIEEAIASKWGDNPPTIKKDRKAARLIDPEDEPDFGGCIAISARTYDHAPDLALNVKDPRTGTWKRVEGDEAAKVFYPGCYVNVVLRFWAQDSREYGKRVNCAIEAVQFHSDGERFGHATVSADDAFGDDDVPEAGSATEADYLGDEDDEAPF